MRLTAVALGEAAEAVALGADQGAADGGTRTSWARFLDSPNVVQANDGGVTVSEAAGGIMVTSLTIAYLANRWTLYSSMTEINMFCIKHYLGF